MCCCVLVLAIKVMDLSEDGFFSLMGEDGEVRDDLKLTENCNPNTPEAVRELLKAVEDSNERLMVRWSIDVLIVTMYYIDRAPSCREISNCPEILLIWSECPDVDLCYAVATLFYKS